MQDPRPRNTRALVAAAVAGLAALVLLGPSRFGAGITSAEAQWLHDARGLAPKLVDAWAGLVASNGIFRAPVLALAVLAAILVALMLVKTRRVSPMTAGAAALAFAAEITLLAGGARMASIAPLAAIDVTLCLVILASGSGTRALFFSAAALVMGLLEPGLAVLPLGAAAGSLVPPSKGSRRAWITQLASMAALIVAGLIVAAHPDGLLWLEGSGRSARTIQKIVLLVGVLGVVHGARHPRAPGPDEDRRHVLMVPALGGVLASLVWLSIPALRSVSTSPLSVLLLAAPPLGVLGIASRARPAADAEGAAKGRVLAGRGTAVMAAILVVLSLAAYAKRRPRPLDVLPIAEALGRLRTSAPEVREILAGPGLTRGVIAHARGRAGFAVVESPREARAGMLAIASDPPTPSERDALASRIGDRVLDRYGLVGEATPLRWTTFRPLALRIDPAGARPNIAIVSIDTLRADHLGVYGYSRGTSPLLDRWAQEALVYERAMSAAPATAPSFSSVMTGRLPIAHGVRKNYEFLDPGSWTLARILARAGYDTAGFISSFVLSRENSGLDLGIAHYDQAFSGREQNREDRPLRLAPELAETVGGWLDGRRAIDRPWFLWVHAIDPHGPYTPLAEFRNAFVGGPSKEVARSLIPDYQWLGTGDFAAYVNAYDDEILQTDRSIGALIAKIESLPSPQGTIVVFTADHGEAFGEHGVYFQHGQSLHTEELHVPLIVKDTARLRTGRVTAPVSLLDLLPTLLARLSIAADLPFDGATLDARERDPATILLANWRPGDVMACRIPWKLIVRGGGRRAEKGEGDPSLRHELLLYDIDADPAESRPVSPRPAAAEALAAEARALAERDPLDAASGRALEKRQWEKLSPEAQEKLRSLGYAGP